MHHGGQKEDHIVILVIDEQRKIQRNYKCNRSMISKYMLYFSQYLDKEDHEGDQLDISIHCDIKIFEWLIKYVDLL